jgi:hypothetical protein
MSGQIRRYPQERPKKKSPLMFFNWICQQYSGKYGRDSELNQEYTFSLTGKEKIAFDGQSKPFIA